MKHTAWIIGAGEQSGARFVAPFLLSFIKKEAGACCDEVIVADAPPASDGVHLLLSASMPYVTAEDMRRLIAEAEHCGGVSTASGGGEYPRCIAGQSGETREVALSEGARISVSDPVSLAEALPVLRKRAGDALLRAGVWLLDPAHAYIDADVSIGPGTVVHPGVTISGGTVIGRDCVLLPNSRIHAARIGDGTTVESSVLTECEIGSRTTVGPFAFIRPGARIGDGCRIGDFVEIKNSSIGNETKVSHLTYVGDSDLGEGINLGCGVVFVNYDGRKKHRTTVEDRAFIGCNVNLVSPVRVGAGAYVAAGSTITEDVPEGALAIARARQAVKPEWVSDRKKKGKL